jgi:Kef-type K+ transport system membrane component KefB
VSVLPLAALSVKSPAGPAWEFLVLFLVVLIGPPLLERARLPGIVGLLIGGYLIGPNGLGAIGAGNTTIPELGQVGLLYLMFVAGVELDLALLRVHRRAVLSFGAITFTIPMALGAIVGISMSWSAAASLLLGSLLASHTLLTYPAVRGAGLASHPAVATAVGATVITDTASLVVLAAVSGTQVSGGSPSSIALQILVGLVVLAVFSLVLLPRLVRFAFRHLGTDRIVRYVSAVTSLLAAATVAQVMGIEGIVGAFFAGIGLNRLVPNEGPLMERIDFFGSAVFVPVFLVSVGMLLKPSVMVEAETLKLAGLFILASCGGKLLAVLASKRSLRMNRPEAILVLGLTMPQAAATLAATIVGYDIGLFDQSVVNAVLVLILISIVGATLLVQHTKSAVSTPVRRQDALGKRVLVALQDTAQAPIGFAIGAKVAAPDSGVVRALLYSFRTTAASMEQRLSELHRDGFALGIDVDPALLVHTSLAEGVIDAAAAEQPSLVLVGQRSAAAHPMLGGPGEAVAAAISVPVAILLGDAKRIEEVVLVRRDHAPETNGDQVAAVAAELASRVGGRGVTVRQADLSRSLSDVVPGQLWIAPADSGQVNAAFDPPAGAAMLLVLQPN